MYSLRTHSSTAFWENKAISTIGFYFLKKGDSETSKQVDFADLKNTKHVQHNNLHMPFVMIDIINAILKEFRNSYASLTNEIYLSPSDFKKIALQMTDYMEASETHTKFYGLFRGVFTLLNKKDSMKSKSFGKLVKPFFKGKDAEKEKALYREFRNQFEKLQTFCLNKNIVIKRSERAYEELKYSLELKTGQAFISAYLNNEKYNNSERNDISDCLFNNAKIKIRDEVSEKPVVTSEENLTSDEMKKREDFLVAQERVIKYKKNGLTHSENLLNTKAPMMSYSDEFNSFLDSLASDVEKKEKEDKIRKMQESLLVKAKMKLMNQKNSEACQLKKDILLYDIHTDASLNENRAGVGAVVCSVNVNNMKSKKLVIKMAGMKQIGTEGKLATQIAELIAIQSIVKHMEDIQSQTGKDVLFRVYSDNQSCIDALQGKSIWGNNGTIRKLLNDIKSSPVRLMYDFEKGHAGNKWNEEAHKLSRYGRRFNEEKFVRV